MMYLIKKNWMICLLLSGAITLSCDDEDKAVLPENPADMPYELDVVPDNFVTVITGNTYFPFPAGETHIFTGVNEDNEPVRVEESYLTETKTILGVTCGIVEVLEYENGALVEETQDWYAQDVDGNMWYFGESVNDYEDGQLVGHDGAWESGVDGALPGIIMLAQPYIGIWYRQEYYENEAEDVAQILSLDETVTVPNGTYTNCLQTAEWNVLEPGVVEHKWYAPSVGVIKVEHVKGEGSVEELSSIE